MNNKKKIVLLFVIILLILGIILALVVNGNETIRRIFTSLVNENEEDLNKKEVVYIINRTNQDDLDVTVIADCSAGINKIITPDNNEIISNKEDKNKIAVDYKINIGQEYVFKIQSKRDSEPEEYKLIANTDDKPVIIQNQESLYPVINEYEVTVNKKVTIDYGENTNNFYSIDNGKTWERYDEEVNIHKPCKLLAKSMTDEKKIQRISSENITITLASDALKLPAYDGDETTMDSEINWRIIDVDSSMVGKGVAIKTYCGGNSAYGSFVNFRFFDEEGNVLGSVTKGIVNLDSNAFTIPEGTVRIKVYSVGFWYLYEIRPYNAPVIIADKKYPKLTERGVEYGYNDITVDYFSTSVQGLYKIDDGEWQDYNDIPVRLELEETIYVKGIDKNGVETLTSSYKAVLSDDALETAAYDGNFDTFIKMHQNTPPGTDTRYMTVDDSMWGRKVRIKWWNWNWSGYYSTIRFLDSSNSELAKYTLPSNQTYDQEYDVPTNSVKMEYYVKFASYSYSTGNGFGKLYEVRPINN